MQGYSRIWDFPATGFVDLQVLVSVSSNAPMLYPVAIFDYLTLQEWNLQGTPEIKDATITFPEAEAFDKTMIDQVRKTCG